MWTSQNHTQPLCNQEQQSHAVKSLKVLTDQTTLIIKFQQILSRTKRGTRFLRMTPNIYYTCMYSHKLPWSQGNLCAIRNSRVMQSRRLNRLDNDYN